MYAHACPPIASGSTTSPEFSSVNITTRTTESGLRKSWRCCRIVASTPTRQAVFPNWPLGGPGGFAHSPVSRDT